MPSERLIRRFEDILDNIRRIERFTAGHDLAAFSQNDKTVFAVLHALLIISEAARKLARQAETLAPGRRGGISAPWETCCATSMTMSRRSPFGGSSATISPV